MVCGARQVGKTTLLKQIKSENKQLQYVTLDYPRLQMLAREDPELFLQQYQPPLIIDEIQYAPELLPYIKIRADQLQRNGMYFLTGSQMFHMMKNASESLAGRIGILTMYSLSGLYFMDTGFACYLTYWNNPRALELSAMSGAMFENYVVSEIIKGYVNQGIDARSRLCYYRDNNGREIDLMILENGRLYPIEIKKSADPGKNALKNFSILNSLPEEIGEGAVICMTPMVIPLDEKNCLVPVSCI